MNVEEVLQKHNGAIQFFVKRYAKHLSEEDKKDMIQDIRVKIIQSWPTYDPEVGSITTWIGRVATSEISSSRRKNSCRPSLVTVSAGTLEAVPDTKRDLPMDMIAALEFIESQGVLNPRQFEVFSLVYAFGLSRHEVGQVTGLTPASAKQIYSVAKLALMAHFGDSTTLAQALAA